MTDPDATGATRIMDPIGLHARPAVKLTKLAKTFQSRVEVRADGSEVWTNAKSPNAMMKMKAAHGATLHFRATGPDAAQCVEELVTLVDRDFDG